MHAPASITLINKICFCSNVSVGGKQNPVRVDKQACKYSTFVVATLHLPAAHVDKELKLQPERDVIYELGCGPVG